MGALDYHDLESLDAGGLETVARALGAHDIAERARRFLDTSSIERHMSEHPYEAVEIARAHLDTRFDINTSRGQKTMARNHEHYDDPRDHSRGNSRDDAPPPRDSRRDDTPPPRGGRDDFGSPRGPDPRDPRAQQRDTRGPDPRQQRGPDPRDQRGQQRDDRGGGQQSRSSRDDAPALLPEGDYKVKCVSHKIGRAGTDTLQIGVRLRILEGEYAGRFLTWYGFFTDKAEETTMKAMRALGFSGDDVRDCASMYTQEAIAVVQHELNQDNVTIARVRWINGAEVQMRDVLTGGDLDRVAQQLRAKFARIPGGASRTESTQQTSRRDDGRGNDRGAPPPRDRRGEQQNFGPSNAPDDDLPF